LEIIGVVNIQPFQSKFEAIVVGQEDSRKAVHDLNMFGSVEQIEISVVLADNSIEDSSSIEFVFDHQF
jgi:hypothetical protein